MKFAFSASALFLAGHVVAFDIFKAASLNCREKPTTKSEVVKVYMMGDDVDIKCQTRGEKVMGGDIWDKTQDGCYVLDYYLYTGFSFMFRGECSDSDDDDDGESGSSSGKDKDESESDEDDNDDDDDSKSGKIDDDDDSKSEKDDDDDEDDSKSGKDVDAETDEPATSNTEIDSDTNEDGNFKENDDDETTSGASALSWKSATATAAGITAGLIASLY